MRASHGQKVSGFLHVFSKYCLDCIPSGFRKGRNAGRAKLIKFIVNERHEIDYNTSKLMPQ